MNIQVDYIIVGLGLAGLAFAETLLENKKSFIVFEDNSQTSSMVAGGVYNPVILKRFTPAWNAHEQIKLAIPFYEKLEKKFNFKIDQKFKIKKALNSIADENNWYVASDKPMLSHYMNPIISKDKINGVIGDFGFGEVSGTGKVDTVKLIEVYREFLKKSNKLKELNFTYDKLSIIEYGVQYENITAKKIIFCEGFGLKSNPFFNYLPLNGTKGETITIHALDLKIDFIVKSSVFVMPIGDDCYKIGATFNRKDKTSTITEQGREELENKLKQVINVPYKVINQSAGIRPTVKDRRPLVGVHSKYPQLTILNGLGTRGVIIAPTVAKNLFNHLEKGDELDKEIDIKRYEE